MLKLLLKTNLYLLVGSMLILNQLAAQEDLSMQSMESSYEEALDFIAAFENDPAILILRNLEEQLISQDLINEPFGLKVQDKLAEALEMDHKDEEAIEKLLYVCEISQGKENWEILANANVSLARLFEKIGREEACINHLRIAGSLIDEHNMEMLYPRYSIRMSSYHRIFADQDSAMYYAEEAIRSSSEQGREELKGTGHLLKGMLLISNVEDADEQAIDQFSLATELWNKVGDVAGVSFAHNNMARIYLELENYKMALVHNDSTLVAAAKATERGHDYLPIFSKAYHYRSHIYQEQNLLDSALHYSNLGHQADIDHLSQINSAKIVWIDAKYNDDLKTTIIQDQEQLLASEGKRKNLLRALIVVFLLFSILLGFFYLRLLSALKRITKQSKTIHNTNQKLSTTLNHSKILQAELHHRVKNNLQIILGLFELQFKGIEDDKSKDQLNRIQQRIHGMAATHEAFNLESEGETNVGEFLSSIGANFKSLTQFTYPIEIDQEVEEFELNMETLMPMGMIINELLTNSVKHFSDAKNKLMISIKVTKSDGSIFLIYKDNGPGFESGSMEQREGGLGEYLINSMVRQLNGRWETSNGDGAKVNIFIKEKN